MFTEPETKQNKEYRSHPQKHDKNITLATYNS